MVSTTPTSLKLHRSPEIAASATGSPTPANKTIALASATEGSLPDGTDELPRPTPEKPADRPSSLPKPADDSTAEVLPESATITLNQVIFASLNGHPVIGAELESIQMAQADYLKATLLPNPQLFNDIQLLPLTQPFTVTRQGGPPQQDVILTYPIDWFLFGKRAAAMTSAHYGIHITQAEFENLIRQRVVVAADAFYTALEAKALWGVAKENVDNLRRMDAITKLAVENGGRPLIESSRVHLDLIAAEQRLRTAEAATRATVARLRAVMGGGEIPVNLDPEGDLGAMLQAQPLSTADAFEIVQ